MWFMFIKLFLIALPVFFAIDIVWLSFVAKNFYSKQIGFLMSSNVNWVAAVIFYLLFIAGLVYFVLTPALEKNSITSAVFAGALFGLVCYATYDLTNMATIKNWPLIVTVVDLVWGMVLSTLVSSISFLLARKFGL